MRQLNIQSQTWPVAGTFRISRSSLTEIAVVNVSLSENGVTGHGECRPYARYDETTETVTALIDSMRTVLMNGASRHEIMELLPPGAARNAVDCALWDLEAKQTGHPVWELAGLPEPRPRQTAFTLSIDTPKNMAKAALKAHRYPILKLKVGASTGLEACIAVAQARPDAKLIIDANEALTVSDMDDFLTGLSGHNIALVEQPLPSGTDTVSTFDNNSGPVICADESLHTAHDLPKLWEAGYRAVNVKLDKCGGLTAGIHLMQTARNHGFTIMAGCMVGTSVAMAPMMILESFADYIDLDGPLLLSKDVKYGLRYEGPIVHPPNPKLWG